MNLRRLGWAGLELEHDGTSIVIDHLLDPGLMKVFFGSEPDALVTPQPGAAAAALITHLHRDHGDMDAIEAAVAAGGRVLRPRPARRPTELDEFLCGEMEQRLGDTALAVTACDPGDTHRVGPFTITALPASDGFGSPQVSWLIDAGGARILHGGDTLWHGGWWNAAALGRIDVAFLPANGVLTAFPQTEPAVDVETVMTPAQAVEAAYALRATTLVPIHYSRTFEHEVYYRPLPDAEAQLRERAARRPLTLQMLPVGEWTSVAALAALPAG